MPVIKTLIARRVIHPSLITIRNFLQPPLLYPDQEDINRDNTLNETEEYFQYTVDLKPPTAPEMTIGQNFIVDKKVVGVKLVDGTSRT